MGEFIPDFGYGSSVRIGNWLEELCLGEDEIRKFLEKREKGELALQKTRKIVSNFFKEVELPFLRRLRFGAVVQLSPTRMKICEKFLEHKPALSLIVNESTMNESQQISDRCEITVAPSFKPCIRNTFIIRSGDKTDRNGEALKYGQSFILQCVEAEEQPLVLFSAPKSANLTSVITTTYKSVNNRGEENLPVGLCLLSKTGAEGSIPLGHCRWKCLHSNPNIRFETQGQNVVSNTEMVIYHVATNQCLAVENVEITTLFGPECLVSVNSYLDIHKTEMWQNYWMVVSGSSHGSK